MRPKGGLNRSDPEHTYRWRAHRAAWPRWRVVVAIADWRFVMISKSLVRRLAAPLVAFFLAFAPMFGVVCAAEAPHKVTVVSFGLFGDQGVFRSEATGAAQIVASRFGGGPVVVRFNTKTGDGATVESLATTLQASAKKMNGEGDVLFLILTSHGSPQGCCHGGTAS
jgi:hypothetical protein